MGGGAFILGPQSKESNAEGRSTVSFDEGLENRDLVHSVHTPLDSDDKSLKSLVDMQKLKLEFTHKQAALSTLSVDESKAACCWQLTEKTSQRIVSHASRRRLHFDSLATFVNGSCFRGFMVTVIIMNAAYAGFVMDVALQAAMDEDANSESYADFATWERGVRKEYPWLFGAELFFTITFVLDICLRVLALEGEFFVGEEAGWNMFDSLLALSSIADMLGGLRADLNFMRVIRITRILRSFRLFSFLRMVPIMRSLRLMTLAIVKSIVPFVLAVFILLEVIFVFSVVIADGVAEYVMFHADDVSDDIRMYLGSLSMTMLSLFMSVSGGVDWWSLGNILLHISVGYLFLFLFFILFTVLAVLNIITGIFVKEAKEMAAKDHHVQVQQDFEENRLLLTNLKQIFQRMDVKNTGCVSIVDFHQTMNDEDVRLQFAQVGLDIQDATAFFKILDQDGSSELSIEEFVMGCMRFKGRANRMDLEVMLMDTKKLMKKMARMHGEFSERLTNIERVIVKADENRIC